MRIFHSHVFHLLRTVLLLLLRNFCFLLLLTCSGCVCQSPHPPDVCSDLCSPLMSLKHFFYYYYYYYFYYYYYHHLY